MTIKPGAFRFNTDSMKLEIFRGSANYEGTASMAGIGTLAAGQWEEIQATSPEVQTGGARGIGFGGHNGTSRVTTIDFITIATTGDSTTFGTATSSRFQKHACASRTRGFAGGGEVSSNTKNIDTVTIASTGSVADYGDLVNNVRGNSGFSNSTRGFSICGENPTAVNILEYFDLASTGEGVDFGDASKVRSSPFAISNSTRGVFGGGRNSPTALYSDIEYITLSTLGNGADFGDLDQAASDLMNGNVSNAVRGLVGGGYNFPGSPITYYDYIQYITTATLGNAADFGNLTDGRVNGCAYSSSTRGVFAGGNPGSSPNVTDRIDYVQIMSLGDSIDFGDLNEGRRSIGGCSNGHGGL